MLAYAVQAHNKADIVSSLWSLFIAEGHACIYMHVSTKSML